MRIATKFNWICSLWCELHYAVYIDMQNDTHDMHAAGNFSTYSIIQMTSTKMISASSELLMLRLLPVTVIEMFPEIGILAGLTPVTVISYNYKQIVTATLLIMQQSFVQQMCYIALYYLCICVLNF